MYKKVSFFSTSLFNSAWSGLPEPENPTGFDDFFKPEPEINPIIWYSLNSIGPEPETQTRGYPNNLKEMFKVHFYQQMVKHICWKLRIWRFEHTTSNLCLNNDHQTLEIWPKPENPTGFDNFFKPEPEINLIIGYFFKPE